MEDPNSKGGVDIDGYGWMTLEKKINRTVQAVGRR